MPQPRYHPREPVLLTERMRQQVARAVRELDAAQAAAYRRMSAATRVGLGIAATSGAQRSAIERLRRRYPEMGVLEARRIVLGIGVAAYERLRREQADKMPR